MARRESLRLIPAQPDERASAPALVDARVVERLRAGDERALEAIMSAYAEPLYAFALTFVRSGDLARDAVQDMFIGLWEARARLDAGVALGPYLFRGVRYRCLNVLRRVRVEERYESRVASGELAVSSATSDPWDDVDHAERYATVIQAVTALPPQQRTAVSLRWGEGLSYAAIAARMNLSVKGVEFHVRRALANLRARLGGEAPD
jgi:RNA polymerase sigma-70 factor, ECF subfamily